MFIGPKALTFNPDQIVGYGKDDGLPRNVIDDSGMRLKQPLEKFSAPGNHKVRLGQLIDHPGLFKAYPGLKRTLVTIASGDKHIGNLNSDGFNRNSGSISMLFLEDRSKAAFMAALAHEVQHNVQQVEGFAGGASSLDLVAQVSSKTVDRLNRRHGQTGNPALATKARHLRMAADLIEAGEGNSASGPVAVARDQLEARGARAYNRASGEVEAYATQNRVSMPAHLQAAPMETAPQVREYNSYERGALRRFARRQKLVLLGEALSKTFNQLFAKPAAAAKPNSLSPAAPSTSAHTP